MHRTAKFTRWKSRSIRAKRLPANSTKIVARVFVCVFAAALMAARI
jgi:hypothetical protein